MSSNPIELKLSAAAGPASEIRPRKRVKLLKRILPRSLFGRSMLILITPLILVQAVATLVFYDRLWDTVMRRFAASVAGDIGTVLAARPLMSDTDWLWYLRLAQGSTEMTYKFQPGTVVDVNAAAEPQGQIERQFVRALTEHLSYPFRLGEPIEPRSIEVMIQLNDGVMAISVPEGRLWSSTSYIFISWMTGTAIVTLAVATMFLRNQIKSLRRLATAAEAFGKGRDVPDFRPEGATEVRQAAAAFLLMRARIQRQITQRTEMLAGVSHDLRTPLTRMKLELALLGENEETVGLRSDVAEMQEMIEGYLDFARGEGAEQPQFLDVMYLLEGIVANARRDGTQISLIGPRDLHIAVKREALKRAVTNLTGNASRYGDHVWVTVMSSKQAVEIIIDDDGPGIPESLRETVFRPFLRLEASRNRETGGVGLGLAIARDLIRGHGGELALESSPQGGLRAHIILPR